MKFSSKPAAGPGGLNGFLDRGTEVTGEIRFEDTLRLDGIFRGKIVSKHTLVVGESGEIDGEIEVGTVSINGRVKGIVRAHDRIEIHSSARVTARLVAPVLVVEEGALLEGEVSMMPGRGAESTPQPAESVPEENKVVSLAGGRRRDEEGRRG